MDRLRKVKKRLTDILEPYAEWEEFPTAEAEQAAKEALQRFLIAIQNTRPDRFYRIHGRGHFSYLRFLGYIDKELRRARYKDACNEIQKLIHFMPITQKRILFDLECLLSEYLENSS